MLIPFITKRGSDARSTRVTEAPNGVYFAKRDEALAKESNT